MGLRLVDLNSSLEGGLFNTSKEVTNTFALINSALAICFQVCHLPVDLLMAGKDCLEIVASKLSLVLEGLQLVFELSSMPLCKFGLRS